MRRFPQILIGLLFFFAFFGMPEGFTHAAAQHTVVSATAPTVPKKAKQTSVAAEHIKAENTAALARPLSMRGTVGRYFVFDTSLAAFASPVALNTLSDLFRTAFRHGNDKRVRQEATTGTSPRAPPLPFIE
jgi:hypothetical protein